jgi:hypothetical protein
MVDYSVGEQDDTENLPVVCRRDREIMLAAAQVGLHD